MANLETNALVDEFTALEQSHGMLNTLAGIQPNDENFPDERNTLLIYNDETGETEVLTFAVFRDAVQEYFRLERETPDEIDVVLVAADDPESVRFCFKNYFSDARDFVDLMREACK